MLTMAGLRAAINPLGAVAGLAAAGLIYAYFNSKKGG